MKKNIMLALLALLMSCNKTYTYIEFSGDSEQIKEDEPLKIRAKNDTLAYTEAYKKFSISQKVSRQSNKTPIYFKLINPDGVDISEISFNTKSEFEKRINLFIGDYDITAKDIPNKITPVDDSLLIEEQSKVIGDIKFGMKKSEVSALIKKFNDEMKREDAVLGSPYFDYFIGNFQYYNIRDYYYKEELYRLDIVGNIVLHDSYDSDMQKSINHAEDVIRQKFGSPDHNRNTPRTYQMKRGYIYTIKQWNIGLKRIEINIEDNGDSYSPILSIYKPSIEERLKEDEQIKQDSILNSTKNIF